MKELRRTKWIAVVAFGALLGGQLLPPLANALDSNNDAAFRARVYKKARAAKSTQVIVIETDPMGSTDAGGFWWDVAVPAISERKEVDAARRGYEEAKKLQRVGD